MLSHMYTFDYEVKLTDNDTTETETHRLLFHANVYAMGEKYGANSVKDAARKKFREAVQSQWSEAIFPDAVKLVYETTPQNDRGLRNVVTKLAAGHARELLTADNDRFRTMMGQVADFGRDLSMELAFLPQVGKDYPAYECPMCESVFMLKDQSNVGKFHCPECNRLRWVNQWEKYRYIFE